ncbi:unnamed protein product [Prorocentrum cordatum]|uniref:Uncharacterized protein n=1 Tax=Prorocentrum cordatum TaxID=2364126 RepID=A0ABN9TC62_9DINO|nr:unnamed protein product [Polarella glacialis]
MTWPLAPEATSAEGWRLRCVQYNPQALPVRRNLTDVLSHFTTAQVVSLTGTCQNLKHIAFDQSLDFVRKRVGKRQVWQWPTEVLKATGRRRARRNGTNVSAGCMIAVDRTIFPNCRRVQNWQPPAGLRGRGGAVRYKWNTHYDLCLISVYSMLEPHDEVGRIWRTKLLRWISDVLDSLPARCTPILMCDGNFHCGYVKIGNTLQLTPVGDAIGHAAPATAMHRVQQIKVWYRDGFNLQLSKSTCAASKNIDHCPLVGCQPHLSFGDMLSSLWTSQELYAIYLMMLMRAQHATASSASGTDLVPGRVSWQVLQQLVEQHAEAHRDLWGTLGRSWIEPFYDMANAFASVSHQALDSVIDAALDVDSAHITWIEITEEQEEFQFFRVREPVTGETVNVYFTTFADDMTSIGLLHGDSQAQLASDKMQAWDDGLKQVVTDTAELDQNGDKKEILFRCHGRGSAEQMQDFYHQRGSIRYKGTAKQWVGHLGGWHNLDGIAASLPHQVAHATVVIHIFVNSVMTLMFRVECSLACARPPVSLYSTNTFVSILWFELIVRFFKLFLSVTPQSHLPSPIYQMDQLQRRLGQGAAGQPAAGDGRAAARRAVGGNFDEEYRSLVVNTAKTVVGLDLMSRRFAGCLTLVALVKGARTQLTAMREAGVTYEEAKTQYKQAGNQEQLAQLKWAHLHVWVGLCMSIVNDATIPAEAKASVLAHSQAVKGVGDIEDKVIVCYQKKAFRQANWQEDMYRIELFTTPELRAEALEIQTCILRAAGSIKKAGSPPKGPNVRKVIQSLVNPGEYQVAGDREQMDWMRDCNSLTDRVWVIEECEYPVPLLLPASALQEYGKKFPKSVVIGRSGAMNPKGVPLLQKEVTSATRVAPGARIVFVSMPRERSCVGPPLAEMRHDELIRLGKFAGWLAKRCEPRAVYFVLPGTVAKGPPSALAAATCAWPLYVSLCTDVVCLDSERWKKSAWARLDALLAVWARRPLYLLPEKYEPPIELGDVGGSQSAGADDEDAQEAAKSTPLTFRQEEPLTIGRPTEGLGTVPPLLKALEDRAAEAEASGGAAKVQRPTLAVRRLG